MHTFLALEEDDWTEVSFLWEIIKARDSNRKCTISRSSFLIPNDVDSVGAMAGYHAALALHPGTPPKLLTTFSKFFNQRWTILSLSLRW